MATWLIGFGSPAAALRRAVRLSEEGKAAEAFPLLARAAKAGNAEAEYRVARCYLEGSGVPASRAEGARWLERAAGRGHIEAQTLLAALCVNGLADLRRSPGKDKPTACLSPRSRPVRISNSALKWSRQAAEAGSAQGQAMLAYVLTNGPEAMRDLEAAHRWYERSAAAGCPEGCLGYALSLAPRTNDAAGRRQVADYLGRAAQAMLPTAVYLLGVLAEQGVGLARDPAAAMELYRNAAELGVRSAQTRWGLALIEGQLVKQDLLNGETWLRRAALAGDAEAAVLVADLNISNGELPPNYTQAASWYRRAAEAGHKAAAHALGSLYLTGEGVAPDPEEAARWLRVSALAGDERSQVDLANLVLQGAGNPEDPASVAQWFEQAAASGDLVASFNLGICPCQGRGHGSRRRAGRPMAAPGRRGPAAGPIHLRPHAGRRARRCRGPDGGARLVHPRRRFGTWRRGSRAGRDDGERPRRARRHPRGPAALRESRGRRPCRRHVRARGAPWRRAPDSDRSQDRPALADDPPPRRAMAMPS